MNILIYYVFNCCNNILILHNIMYIQPSYIYAWFLWIFNILRHWQLACFCWDMSFWYFLINAICMMIKAFLLFWIILARVRLRCFAITEHLTDIWILLRHFVKYHHRTKPVRSYDGIRSHHWMDKNLYKHKSFETKVYNYVNIYNIIHAECYTSFTFFYCKNHQILLRNKRPHNNTAFLCR